MVYVWRIIYICAVNLFCHLANIATFQLAYSQFHLLSGVIRIHSALRNNCERGDLGMQAAATQESSAGLGLSTNFGLRWVTYSHICTPIVLWLVCAQVALSCCARCMALGSCDVTCLSRAQFGYRHSYCHFLLLFKKKRGGWAHHHTCLITVWNCVLMVFLISLSCCKTDSKITF